MIPSNLKAAARTFSLQPAVGDPTAGHTGATIRRVVGDFKTTALLLSGGETRLCLVASPFPMESVEMREAIQRALGEAAGFKPGEIVTVTSHNHCTPLLVENGTIDWARPPGAPARGRLNRLGLEFIAELRRVAAGLPAGLAPVSVEWGRSREERITYNRRGRRPDGTSYFIREEDRQLLGESYIGQIDPEATVVVLRGGDGRPVAALAHFTGHPVTAYNPENPIAWGEYPQVACEKLSEALAGAPVAFLQGCAADINAKFLLTGTVEQSRQFGEFLGQTFVAALAGLRASGRSGLGLRKLTVDLPLAELPEEISLRRDLAEIDDFIRRCERGDENTLACVGLNFPRALSPAYRAKLVQMIHPWFEWALAIRQDGRLDQVPRSLPVEIAVARCGDIGLVGLPFEPYVRTGLKIKREAPLPCVMPCGYTMAEHGYVPDASAVDDREYMSGFFRYTRFRPPFRAPAGDAAAAKAVEVLGQL